MERKEQADADVRSTPLADLIWLLKFMKSRCNADYQFLETVIEKELARRGRLAHFGRA